MKKFLVIFIALAVLCSCTKEEVEVVTPQYNDYQKELLKAMTPDETTFPLFQTVAVPSVDAYQPENTQWVDLDLPSGTLWADRNIGATNKLDFGWYLAWGEITPKSNYSWNTYKWWDGVSTYTKDAMTFCIPSKYEGATEGHTLEDADDPCTVYLGGDMPTYEDFIELVQNTDISFTESDPNAAALGIPDCIVFTSRTNKNNLIFPLAGQYEGTKYYSGFRNTRYYSQCGKVGYYWMDTTYIRGALIPYKDESYYITMNKWFYGRFGVTQLTTYIALDRCDGYSVRAVKYANK